MKIGNTTANFGIRFLHFVEKGDKDLEDSYHLPRGPDQAAAYETPMTSKQIMFGKVGEAK